MPLLALVLGCASLMQEEIVIHRHDPLPSKDEGSLMAGAAKVDITGAPGFPMAGHSRLGKASRGVRTRLYARAVYLKPKTGRPVALVQVDLLSGSLPLHHRVAELIAPRTDVEAAGLVIAGTHTHSAQGNYFGIRIYDRMASSKPGFDRDMFEFLAGRIAEAVIRAYESRRPAKIATGSITVFNATRNRSLPAYRMNPGTAHDVSDPRDAVNPELRMIRVDCRADNGGYVPIGAFSTFSMHPNLAHEDTEALYNGDVTAYAERVVEFGIRRLYPSAVDPIHAVANSTHGDITPDYEPAERLGYPAMRRIGTIIGKRAMELFVALQARLTDDVVISYRAMEFDVFRDRCIDGICLCEKPVAGASAFGGALDRPNRFLNWIPGFAPGWPKRCGAGDCQGRKRVLGGYRLQHRVFPAEEYPHILFLQAVRVHDTVLLPLPFEVSVEAGRRMAFWCGEAARAAGLRDPLRFIVADTANDYWGYCTTPEEFSLQYYEGGQTLYGPNTTPFLAAHLARLAASLSEKSQNSLPERWAFTVSVPQSKKNKQDRVPDVTPLRAQEHTPLFVPKGRSAPEPYWAFRWRDIPPDRICLHEPLARIEASADGKEWRPLVHDGRPMDDTGWDIAVICPAKPASGGGWIYEARWYNPPPAAGRLFRFCILPRPGVPMLCSPAFQ